jgi:hypothetical protein
MSDEGYIVAAEDPGTGATRLEIEKTDKNRAKYTVKDGDKSKSYDLYAADGVQYYKKDDKYYTTDGNNTEYTGDKDDLKAVYKSTAKTD